jgi:hypothetical protein
MDEDDRNGDAVAEDYELSALKQSMSDKTGSGGEVGERTVALISRSSSFFKREGDFEYHVIPFESGSKFNGLLSYLCECCGGNPHDKGAISVTGLSWSGDQDLCHPKQVCDVQSNSYFHSQVPEGNWIQYDFKTKRVAVTHYSLRSSSCGVNRNQLKSWIVEGQNEQGNWIELDRRLDCPNLNGPRAGCDFEVQRVIEARAIRLKQAGPTWGGSGYYLLLEAFELFHGLRVPA